MSSFVMILALLLVTVVVCEIGNRIKLPWPALMVLVGVGIAWIPGGHMNIPRDMVLPLLLPPLLYTAAERTSWQMFRNKWRSMVVFALALTVVTTATVTGAAWLLYPGIGLPSALLLGAMVAPPDPIAVEAVSKDVPLPRRILSTLQTEGLFNDAVALVIFEVALEALLHDSEITPRLFLNDFLVGLVLAVVVGFLTATIIRWIVRLSDSAIASAAATLVLPYGAYLLADLIGASGVLAVVVAALEYRRTESPDDVQERLVRTSFWEVAELAISGIAFGLIGEGFQDVIKLHGAAVWPMVWKGLGIAIVVVATRFIYLAILIRVNRSNHFQLAAPRNWRDAVIMTWGGMRGLITLALAVSLPSIIGHDHHYFDYRSQIVVAACMVLVVTLLLAGLTMPLLMRKIKIADEGQDEVRMERELVHAATKEALVALHGLTDIPEPITARYEALIEQIESELLERSVAADLDEEISTRRQHRAAYLSVQQVALGAARESIVGARNRPGVDPVVVDRILQRLDLRSSVLRRPHR